MNYRKYIKDNILKIILVLYIVIVIILHIKQSTENFTEHFCFFGCSSSSSTVNNKYSSDIINKSDLEVLNKNVNDFQTNTIVNQASNCSAGLAASNSVAVIGSTARNIEISDIDQTNSGTVSFDCVQQNSYANEVTSGIATTYLSELNNAFATDVLDKIDSTTAANASSGFLSTGSADSSSRVNTDYRFNNVTDTRKNIQNVVENSIRNNLSLNDTQDCVTTLKTSNSVGVLDVDAEEDIKIRGLNQINSAAILSKCLQKKNNSNRITNNILTDLGIRVSEESTVKKIGDLSSSASSVAVVTGPLQDLGALLSGLFSGPIIIALIIASICITIAVVYFTKKKSDNGEFQNSSQGSNGSDGFDGSNGPDGNPIYATYISNNMRHKNNLY